MPLPPEISKSKVPSAAESVLQPNSVDFLITRGLTLHQQGKFKEAQAIYEQVLAIQPDHFDVLQLLFALSAQTKQFIKAVDFLSKALRINPNHAESHNNRGVALQELHRFNEALASYDEAISIKADYAEAYNNRGNALQELKRLDDAVASYDKAISIESDYADAYNNRGIALQELKRLDEAIASYDKAIAIEPSYADVYNNRGVALQELKRLDEAIASYDEAITIEPNYAEAYNNRGNILGELNFFDEAIVSYDKAIAIKTDYAEAYNNRGNTLGELNRLDKAIASYDKAIAIKVDYSEAYNNRGLALKKLRRLDESIVSYDKAIAIKPDYAEAYNNRGNALQELKRLDEAIASYDKAITIKTDYVEAYNNRGNALQELKRLDEAIASYAKAHSIKYDHNYLLGTLAHAKMKVCDWSDLVLSREKITEKINANEKISIPFPVLALTDNPVIAKRCAQIYVLDKYPTNLALGPIPKRATGKKIRLGYFSADFGEHPVSYLTTELFEMHNKEQFEIFAFSLKNRNQDQNLIRIKKAFNHFIDVTSKSDLQVAQLARELKIDIAVDLGGFTFDSRIGIFAYRVAPIQLSYIGYLGTMGGPYFDYLIADNTIIPPESQHHYTEKIIYLPSYQVNDRKRMISDKQFTRAELDLPEAGFIFACFNSNYKILPDVFDGWMRILQKIDDSVLFLFADNHWAEANLKKEAQSRGIDPQRLIFGKRIPRDQYLARYRVCDLFLDTAPYNAGTTASDALWVGLPVLTLIGKSFASRVAASLLSAIDLPELITHSQEEYEALAIDLATNPQKLAAIQHKLMANRLTSPLFNTPLFTKHIEAAYTQIAERYWADLLPAQIEIGL